ncbi:MAG: hypothetical protein JXD23_07885 [Spirochaetales bacterium]|nr:hypothetical protein [Spirochaetales bacterium]
MFKPKHDKFSDKRKGGGKFGGFNKSRDKGFGGGFNKGRDKGDRSFGGGWDREERAVFDAVCDQCGRSCTVPFKPTGSRPVLCKQCFKGESDSGPKRFGGKDRGRPSFRNQDRDFRKGGERQPDLKGLERQMRDINRKLDLILESLAPAEPKKKKKAGGKKKEAIMEEENPLDETDIDDDMTDDDEDYDDDFEDDEDLDDDDDDDEMGEEE